MHLSYLFFLPFIILNYCPFITSITYSSTNVLTQGSSIAVENYQDHLVSPNGLFTAGFHQIGQNAYFFAIWFSEFMADGSHTFVWMANRDEPVNGKRSMFYLSKSGNLVLTDAGNRIWMSNTKSTSPLQLQLLNSGNLVLKELGKNPYIWESFSFPTNTILPNQLFTKDTILVSSRSLTNFSSGFYSFYFDNDNIIRIVYNSDEITSVYWPKPWLLTLQAGRSPFNNSRYAFLDSIGRFISTDNYTFATSDNGLALQRRMTLDVDGNVRVYTLKNRKWTVSSQTISKPCLIHGSCGQNSLCTYSLNSKRRCTCLHGYTPRNHSDISFGCKPTFDLNEDREKYDFLKLPYTEFYGFDSLYMEGVTFKVCKEACLNDTSCKAFQYTFNQAIMTFKCYLKTLLFNGHTVDTPFTTYIKLPKNNVSAFNLKATNQSELNCSSSIIKLERTYVEKSENGSLKFILWFSIILGVSEATCFIFFYYITRQSSGATTQSYLASATGFKRFTYDEIIKMSNNFRDVIGRGGGGIVYKGILPDTRVVAIKRLHETSQGEAEFLAEMSTIGRINHKNLIETYGYCAERKHRILVYEYMENGSLASNLHAKELDCQKRFEIAIGAAKGLAYLHEECLEWVLHCDVKPHNILLDADYNPKVADFGLSKLFHQGLIDNSIFSRIRGTRGYMAPEWVYNLPITSKVDVYSYGMVVLEMITGRDPTWDQGSNDNKRVDQKTLVSWVREKVDESGNNLTNAHILDILDPTMKDEYEDHHMKTLLKVALQCVEENKDVRPTMSEVVKILLNLEMDY